MSTEATNVCLIQDYLAPYRIPLFAKIAAADQINFKLLLMARLHPSYQQWGNLWRNPPFECVLVEGWRFHLRSEAESGFNPTLFVALMRLDPDVIICGGFSLNTALALAYKILFRKRLIVWTEATSTTESYLPYLRVRTLIRGLIARCVDGYIDAGTQARDYAQSLTSRNRNVPFFRSYNAIDNNNFARRCDIFRNDKVALNAFCNRFAPRNILFSGQLIERKNVRRLVEVYEEILERSGPNIGLIVLGQGPLEEYLLKYKQTHKLKHLYLEGFQLTDDYFKYFAAADVFMLLSVYDCNPLVIFEALAAGLATICSKHAGNAIDLITDGENGFIVDPENIADIATKTSTILDTEDRGAICAAARKAVQKANYDDAAQAFVDAVQKIVRA